MLCSRWEFLYVSLEILDFIRNVILKLPSLKFFITSQFLLQFIHIFIVIKVTLWLVLESGILLAKILIIGLGVPIHVQIVRCVLRRLLNLGLPLMNDAHIWVHILVLLTCIPLEKLPWIYLQYGAWCVRRNVDICSLVFLVELKHLEHFLSVIKFMVKFFCSDVLWLENCSFQVLFLFPLFKLRSFIVILSLLCKYDFLFFS